MIEKFDYGDCNSPHVDEMLPCLVGGPKVRHAALIDDTDLVKVLVQRLSSLVDGNDGGRMEDVGRDAQGLDKLKSGAGVEASSRTNCTSVTFLCVT